MNALRVVMDQTGFYVTFTPNTAMTHPAAAVFRGILQ